MNILTFHLTSLKRPEESICTRFQITTNKRVCYVGTYDFRVKVSEPGDFF